MPTKSATRGSETVLIGTSLGESPVCRHFAALGRELANLGYAVSLLVDGRDGDRSYLDERISVLRWPSPRPTRLADALFLNRRLSQSRPSCIISNFGANNLMLTLGALRQVPVRVHWYHTLLAQNRLDMRGSRLRARLQFMRARIIYRCATHTVANSGAAKRELLEELGIRPNTCHVFWNCLDNPASDAAGRISASSQDPCSFVCVGRFAPSKGQDVLVRAIARAARALPQLKVDFIGQGPTSGECRALSAELGVTERCRFLGYLPHDDVLKRMTAARATIVPSRCESFGLVVIESMAVGVPVIGSRTGGISEIIRDGVDGWLFPPEDDRALADRIVDLGQNDLRRSQMSQESRRRYLQHFETSMAVTQQAKWLNQIIRRPEADS